MARDSAMIWLNNQGQYVSKPRLIAK